MLNAFLTLVGAVTTKIPVLTAHWKLILGVAPKLKDGDAETGIVTPTAIVRIGLLSKTFWNQWNKALNRCEMVVKLERSAVGPLWSFCSKVAILPFSCDGSILQFNRLSLKKTDEQWAYRDFLWLREELQRCIKWNRY